MIIPLWDRRQFALADYFLPEIFGAVAEQNPGWQYQMQIPQHSIDCTHSFYFKFIPSVHLHKPDNSLGRVNGRGCRIYAKTAGTPLDSSDQLPVLPSKFIQREFEQIMEALDLKKRILYIRKSSVKIIKTES